MLQAQHLTKAEVVLLLRQFVTAPQLEIMYGMSKGGMHKRLKNKAVIKYQVGRGKTAFVWLPSFIEVYGEPLILINGGGK